MFWEVPEAGGQVAQRAPWCWAHFLLLRGGGWNLGSLPPTGVAGPVGKAEPGLLGCGGHWPQPGPHCLLCDGEVHACAFHLCLF